MEIYNESQSRGEYDGLDTPDFIRILGVLDHMLTDLKNENKKLREENEQLRETQCKCNN